jgi:DNA-binding MarR family transcriptional regulator
MLSQENYMELFRRSICVGRKIKIVAKANLERIGYTWPEFDTLRSIKDDAAVQLSDLSKKLERQKSNQVPIINSFEEKGYIIRKRDPQDRRVIWISLTDKGKEEKKRLIEFQRNFIIEYLCGLDEDFVKEFNKNLDELNKYLDRMDGNGQI